MYSHDRDDDTGDRGAGRMLERIIDDKGAKSDLRLVNRRPFMSYCILVVHARRHHFFIVLEVGERNHCARAIRDLWNTKYMDK